MYNSKYSGATVEALLDAVSGKTIYTAGTNVTIENGVISSTGGGGGGGSIDEDMYNGLQKAVAKILTDQKAKNKEIDTNLAAKPSMSEIEAQFVNNSELEAALVAFMRSDAYHAIHDPQEHAIAAGFNDLDSRVIALEERIAALEALLLVTGVNSAYTVVQMTEAEYSAATKNANTIYYVTSGATA